MAVALLVGLCSKGVMGEAVSFASAGGPILLATTAVDVVAFMIVSARASRETLLVTQSKQPHGPLQRSTEYQAQPNVSIWLLRSCISVIQEDDAGWHTMCTTRTRDH